jgi:hypothetical protein
MRRGCFSGEGNAAVKSARTVVDLLERDDAVWR